MNGDDRTTLLTYLQGFLTPQRRRRFEEILLRRTRWLTVVLEDVYQPQNHNAVLRTCEALGLQDVHVIERCNQLEIDGCVSLGAARWLTIHRHPGAPSETAGDATRNCLERLKSDGYRILVATPHPPATPLPDCAIDRKTALVVGHETNGVSRTALELADERVVIPIQGFAESFNLSVATALCLYDLRCKLDASDICCTLTEQERDELRFEWTRQSVPHVEAIAARFRATGER